MLIPIRRGTLRDGAIAVVVLVALTVVFWLKGSGPRPWEQYSAVEVLPRAQPD